MKQDPKFKKFGSSDNKNFMVIDSVPTKHAFVIGQKHVEYASDNHKGVLGDETIQKIPCARCGNKLDWHEKALLVGCKKDFNTSDDLKKELEKYLISIKTKTEKSGYVGFAFLEPEEKN